MADLSAYQFKADLATFARGLDLNVQTLVRKLAGELWEDIIKKTPVDTGRARAGWAMLLDAPHETLPPEIAAEVLAERAATRKAGGKPGPILEPPGKPDFVAITGEERVFITNNVEYIEALEDGHSKQAPAGMVRTSLAALEVRVDYLVAQINAQTP